MSDLEHIIMVLESSVDKHREKPLTNKWLLNIVKMAERNSVNIYWDELQGLTMDDIL